MTTKQFSTCLKNQKKRSLQKIPHLNLHTILNSFFIIFLSMRILNALALNQISLVIEQGGDQNLLSPEFAIDDSNFTITVNGELKPSCKKECYLTESSSNIIVASC